MIKAIISMLSASIILIASPASADSWGDYADSLPLFLAPPPPPEGYPPSFSWRSADVGGGTKDYISSIKDQRPCEICTIFATVAAVETTVMINEDIPRGSPTEPDLSEWFLTACPDGLETYENCQPLSNDVLYVAGAMDLLRSTGTVDEEIFPLVLSPPPDPPMASLLPCSEFCRTPSPSDWYKVVDIRKVEVDTTPDITPDDLIAAIHDVGPVITTSKGFNPVPGEVVLDDTFVGSGYKSCTWPSSLGSADALSHGILIIGYEWVEFSGEDVLFLEVKNSWGPLDDYCDGGICKIRFMNCVHGEYLTRPDCRYSCEIGLDNAVILDLDVGPLALSEDPDRDGSPDDFCDNCPGLRNTSQANCDEEYDAELWTGEHDGGDACDPDPCVYINGIGESMETTFFPHYPTRVIERGRMMDVSYTPVGYNEESGEDHATSDVLLNRCQCTSYWGGGLHGDEGVCDAGGIGGIDNCNRAGAFEGDRDLGIGWLYMNRVAEHDMPESPYSYPIGPYDTVEDDFLHSIVFWQDGYRTILEGTKFREQVVNREIWDWREEPFPYPYLHVGCLYLEHPDCYPQSVRVGMHPEAMSYGSDMSQNNSWLSAASSET